jgi:hypothetical protein
VVQAKSNNDTKKGVLTIKPYNQGMGGNTKRTKIGPGWGGVARVTYRLRTKISKRNLKHETFARQRLPKVIRLALGGYRTMVVKSETIYATMQPPEPSASTGTEGMVSASGELEAMVKRSAKESIDVIVWCVV